VVHLVLTSCVCAAFHLVQRTDTVDVAATLARGRTALAATRFDDARAAFEELVKARPADVRAWTLLARSRCGAAEVAYAKGGEGTTLAAQLVGAAEEAARKAVDLDAESPDAWAELGHVLARSGQTEEAIATLYHAEQLAPTSVELGADLCDALLAARDDAFRNGDGSAASSKLAEAQAVLDRAARGVDGVVALLRRRAEVHALGNAPQLALAELRRAIALAPQDTTLLERHLELVQDTESFDAAIDFYTGLVDAPALSRWYRSRAHEFSGHHLETRQRDYAGAAAEYQKAEHDFAECAKLDAAQRKAVDAWIPSLRAFRGHALTLAEKFPEAEAALLSAIDLDHGQADALRFLHELQDAMWKKFGGDAMPKERKEEMRAFASRLATVEPGNSQNWNNWGLFARDAGKYEESYLAYRRALELEPENPNFLNDTALILMYHLDRDLDRAQQWLEKAVEVADATLHRDGVESRKRADAETALGDAYGNLVNLLQGTGRKEQAVARLREFATKLPKRSEVDYWRKQLLPEEWQAEQDAKAAAASAAKKGDGSP
jgi:tetratricopeptide (TPR) repeat protein